MDYPFHIDCYEKGGDYYLDEKYLGFWEWENNLVCIGGGSGISGLITNRKDRSKYPNLAGYVRYLPFFSGNPNDPREHSNLDGPSLLMRKVIWYGKKLK